MINITKIKIAGGIIVFLSIIALGVSAIERHTAATEQHTAITSDAISASQAEHERLASDPDTIKVPEDN